MADLMELAKRICAIAGIESLTLSGHRHPSLFFLDADFDETSIHTKVNPVSHDRTQENSRRSCRHAKQGKQEARVPVPGHFRLL